VCHDGQQKEMNYAAASAPSEEAPSWRLGLDVVNYTQFNYDLNMSFNRKNTWSTQEKKTIQQLLIAAFEFDGVFRQKMVMEYNIVHIVKEIHTTEAGRHFNIQLFHNPQIIEKPRITPPGSCSSIIHCRVCKDLATGQLYIAKFSQIIEWL